MAGSARLRPERTLPAVSATAPLLYLLENRVPINWIPFLPIALNAIAGQIELQMGAMLPPDQDPAPVRPIGRILNSTNLLPPAEPYTLREEEVSRAGIQVSRILARTRWLDGSTHLWIARRKNGGQGEGSSNLKFDLALDVSVDEPPLAVRTSLEELNSMPFLITITGKSSGSFQRRERRGRRSNTRVSASASRTSERAVRSGHGASRRGSGSTHPIRSRSRSASLHRRFSRHSSTTRRLAEARFDFYKTDAAGVKNIVYSVRISAALIVDVTQKT